MVYILMHICNEYNEIDIMGVYDTLEKAKAKMKELTDDEVDGGAEIEYQDSLGIILESNDGTRWEYDIYVEGVE